MLTVGSDVVDLIEAGREERDLPRFDGRVFSEPERRLIHGPHDRWRLWTAKEAAYKAALKRFGTLDFVHRDFSVHDLGDGRGTVTHDTFIAHVSWEDGAEWVHSVAAIGPCSGEAVGQAIWSVSRTGNLNPAEESQAAHRLAHELAGAAGVPSGAWSISVSHHGQFVSAAVLDDGYSNRRRRR